MYEFQKIHGTPPMNTPGKPTTNKWKAASLAKALKKKTPLSQIEDGDDMEMNAMKGGRYSKAGGGIGS
ncbi:MAG TPA: hypothetical protein VFH83_01535 [Spirochaetia bacterium]|nr:hypothetical protein [Spirochaetia bacterium]